VLICCCFLLPIQSLQLPTAYSKPTASDCLCKACCFVLLAAASYCLFKYTWNTSLEEADVFFGEPFLIFHSFFFNFFFTCPHIKAVRQPQPAQQQHPNLGYNFAFRDGPRRNRPISCVSIRQHTSAYVRIRQHTSAYVSMRQQKNLVCGDGLRRNRSVVIKRAIKALLRRC
jgi:hypothetical protein